MKEIRTKSRGKRVLRLVLLMMAAIVVLFVVEHLRGRWSLNRWKRERTVEGEKFEVSQLWPSPSEHGVEFSNQLAQTIVQLRKLNPYAGRLSTMIVASPGHCRRASQESQLPFWDNRPPTNTWGDLDEVCQQSQPTLQALHELMKKPASSMGYDITKRLENNSPVILISSRVGAQSLHAAIMNDLHKGDLGGTIRNLETLMSFTRLYEKDPGLVNLMVRQAILNLSFDVCWDALQAEGWSERQLAALQQQYVENRRMLSEMPRALEAERAERVFHLRWFRSHNYQSWITRNKGVYESFGAKLPESEASSGVLLWRQLFFHPLWSFAWADQEEFECLQHMQRDLQLLREAVQRQSLLELQEQMAANHQKYKAPVAPWRFYMKIPLVDNLIEVVTPPKSSPPLPSKTPTPKLSASIVKSSEPEYPYTDFSRAWSSCMSYLTRNEMLITAIAIKRYELSHGKPPFKLQALMPEFLSAIPTDLMDGQPLRYRVNPDGTVTLYSVGYNKRDDGGSGQFEYHADSGDRSPWGAQDWIWPQAAPDRDNR